MRRSTAAGTAKAEGTSARQIPILPRDRDRKCDMQRPRARSMRVRHRAIPRQGRAYVPTAPRSGWGCRGGRRRRKKEYLSAPRLCTVRVPSKSDSKFAQYDDRSCVAPSTTGKRGEESPPSACRAYPSRCRRASPKPSQCTAPSALYVPRHRRLWRYTSQRGSLRTHGRRRARVSMTIIEAFALERRRLRWAVDERLLGVVAVVMVAGLGLVVVCAGVDHKGECCMGRESETRTHVPRRLGGRRYGVRKAKNW